MFRRPLISCNCLRRPSGARLVHNSPPRSFRDRIPFSPVTTPTKSVFPATVFCVGVSTLAFGTAAYLTNTDAEKRLESLGHLTRYPWTNWNRDLQFQLASARMEEQIDKARKFIAEFPRDWRWPSILAQNWLDIGEAKRTVWGIGLVCVGVWGVWQIPRYHRITKWLVHNPLVNRPITLLTSVFSHQSFTHLLFNSLALLSFGPSTIALLNQQFVSREPDENPLPHSTSRYEFLAFFVTGGLVSSLVSQVWSLKVLFPRGGASGIIPSLGASGAIYSCLAATALGYPETLVSIIFFPFFPFSIGNAFFSMMALDAIGLLRGWRMFDHAAHLGGAVFGMSYATWGHEAFQKLRARIGNYNSDGSKKN